MRLARIQLAASALLGGGGLARLAPAADPGPPAPPRPESAPPAPPADPTKLYPFKLDADDVREYVALTVTFGDVRIDTGPVAAIPLTTERGVTGVLLDGDGRYAYMPQKGPSFQGHSRAALLRFDPDELAKVLPPGRGRRVVDRGLVELSRLVLPAVVRHCYQGTTRADSGERRQDLMIPPKGAFAATLLTREHGDLLISVTETTATVHSFTDRKTLLEKK